MNSFICWLTTVREQKNILTKIDEQLRSVLPTPTPLFPVKQCLLVLRLLPSSRGLQARESQEEDGRTWQRRDQKIAEINDFTGKLEKAETGTVCCGITPDMVVFRIAKSDAFRFREEKQRTRWCESVGSHTRTHMDITPDTVVSPMLILIHEKSDNTGSSSNSSSALRY